jgi:DNA-binding FrmR family transcriptional regulator
MTVSDSLTSNHYQPDHEHHDAQKHYKNDYDDHDYPDHIHTHIHDHPHQHSPESLRKLINRLSRIEGHIRGIKNMLQESRPCPEVLIQIAAIRGALDRVARMILDEHLTECVTRAAAEGNIETEIAELKAALDRFLP